MKNIDKLNQSRSSRMKGLRLAEDDNKSFGSSISSIESFSIIDVIIEDILFSYSAIVEFKELPDIPPWKYLTEKVIIPIGSTIYGYKYNGKYIFSSGDDNIVAIESNGFKEEFKSNFKVDYDEWKKTHTQIFFNVIS